MADNKVKQIIDAIRDDTLLGLNTTKANVFVHRASEVDDSILPALNIRVGPLTLVRDHIDTQDWELTVFIESYVLENEGYWEEQLLIQKEVHVAMREDYQLGLTSFVHDTVAAGSEDGISVNRDQNVVVTQMINEWNITFRAGLNDISV